MTLVCIARVMGLQYSLSGSGMCAASSAVQILLTSVAWSFPTEVSSGSAARTLRRETARGQNDEVLLRTTPGQFAVAVEFGPVAVYMAKISG
jgi:hypothetical protein